MGGTAPGFMYLCDSRIGAFTSPRRGRGCWGAAGGGGAGGSRPLPLCGRPPVRECELLREVEPPPLIFEDLEALGGTWGSGLFL